MLGLRDQVRRNVNRVGGFVGDDRDLGRPGLGVDRDGAAQQPLGGGDVDVAGTGDHVDRLDHGAVHVDRAEREQRDALRTAGRVDLVDAEQRAGRQHVAVRPAVVVLLRRGGDRDRPHPGHLRRHHVHHHAGRVQRQPARHVQPDPADRHPALGHGAAGGDLGDLLGRQLRGVARPWPARSIRSAPPAPARTPPRQRPRSPSAGTRSDAGRTPSNRSEASSTAAGAALPDVLDQRSDAGGGGADVRRQPAGAPRAGCRVRNAGRSSAAWG